MTTLLKYMDKLGKEFKFTIQGDTFRTRPGGVISLLYYIGGIVLSYYFGKDLYYKKDPNVIEQSSFSESYPFFQLNNSNFLFGFAIANGFHSIFNLSFYDGELLLQYVAGDKIKSLSTYANRCDDRYS